MRPGTGMGNPVHLVIQNSTALGKAAEWATMDFWIVKQKDTELKSTSQFNALDIHNPLIDFSQYVNGENIEQEDLVIYFNLGGHHVPHSGDIPNTLMHTSASSIMFVPHNFHDRDPSRQSSTGVRLDVANRSNTKYYGGRIKEDLKVKLSDIEPDMRDYNAKDHPVRKFT
ncbi:copper amine oxidase [Phlyctema vagabunda]|uniref:Amine oxidase n=1 Tax=Phlyctema vagabunda TaxID=108571 RepID=A0ABR4P7Z6_9HELO